MPAIGIDTHKRTLAACAVDDVGTVIAERTFDSPVDTSCLASIAPPQPGP